MSYAHQLKDCPCCHQDRHHAAFPNAIGEGTFVLCALCSEETWEDQAGVFKSRRDELRSKLRADPTNEALAIAVQFFDAVVELFDSKAGDKVDERRWADAMNRITAITNELQAIHRFTTESPKGTA